MCRTFWSSGTRTCAGRLRWPSAGQRLDLGSDLLAEGDEGAGHGRDHGLIARARRGLGHGLALEHELFALAPENPPARVERDVAALRSIEAHHRDDHLVLNGPGDLA